jgi:hypothetical protein
MLPFRAVAFSRQTLLILLLLLVGYSAVLGQGKRRGVPRHYIEEKDSCRVPGASSVRSFGAGHRRYQVRYEVFCTDQYSVRDTVPERATVFLYPERNVRIQLVSAGTKEVVINKARFSPHFAGEAEWPKLNLGTTTIDRIDEANHLVLFSTFVGHAYADQGWLLKYAVDVSGNFTYLGLEAAGR